VCVCERESMLLPPCISSVNTLCVHVCVKERETVRVREIALIDLERKDRLCVCVRERDRVCVCECVSV